MVKIINNTFKKIRSTKQDQEVKGRVTAFKEELKTRKDLIKLQNQFRDQYKLASLNNLPSYVEEFNTRVVTPMFTIPRHQNDLIQIMRQSQREVFSASTQLREGSLRYKESTQRKQTRGDSVGD